MKIKEVRFFCEDSEFSKQELRGLKLKTFNKANKPTEESPIITRPMTLGRVLWRTAYALLPCAIVGGVVNTTNPDLSALLFSKGETLVSSVSQKLTPTTTPTPTPPTTPVVVALPTPTPVPQKCPIVSRLGSYTELVEFCNKNSPFLGSAVTMKGDNNPLDQDQKLVHTNESGYDLKFMVVESKPLPKKTGEEQQKYSLSISAVNEQLQQVCSRYWYKNTTGKIACVLLPEPTYQTPWGLVAPGENKTFTTTVVEGGVLEINARSVDTERYQKEIQSYENNSDWTRIPPEIGEEGLRY